MCIVYETFNFLLLTKTLELALVLALVLAQDLLRVTAELPGEHQGSSGEWRRRSMSIHGRWELEGLNLALLTHAVMWQVGLVSSTGSRPWCGGSLLSTRHVPTAAHCTAAVGGNPAYLRVVVGEHDTTDSAVDIRTVSTITDHPNYAEYNNYAYDVSILTLSSPLTFSRVVAPVCLPSSVSPQYTGQLATVTGWGTTSSGGYLPARLMEVDVTVVSNTQCNNAYGGIQR